MPFSGTTTPTASSNVVRLVKVGQVSLVGRSGAPGRARSSVPVLSKRRRHAAPQFLRLIAVWTRTSSPAQPRGSVPSDAVPRAQSPSRGPICGDPRAR
jgi:hypothetical protein